METRTLIASCSRDGCRWFALPGEDRCQRHVLLDQGWHVTFGPEGQERWWRYGKRYTLRGACRAQKASAWSVGSR